MIEFHTKIRWKWWVFSTLIDITRRPLDFETYFGKIVQFSFTVICVTSRLLIRFQCFFYQNDNFQRENSIFSSKFSKTAWKFLLLCNSFSWTMLSVGTQLRIEIRATWLIMVENTLLLDLAHTQTHSTHTSNFD